MRPNKHSNHKRTENIYKKTFEITVNVNVIFKHHAPNDLLTNILYILKLLTPWTAMLEHTTLTGVDVSFEDQRGFKVHLVWENIIDKPTDHNLDPGGF